MHSAKSTVGRWWFLVVLICWGSISFAHARWVAPAGHLPHGTSGLSESATRGYLGEKATTTLRYYDYEGLTGETSIPDGASLRYDYGASSRRAPIATASDYFPSAVDWSRVAGHAADVTSTRSSYHYDALINPRNSAGILHCNSPNPYDYDPLRHFNAAETAALRSNADLVQQVATRAERWGVNKGYGAAGTGPVQGTFKHGYADRLLQRYQRMEEHFTGFQRGLDAEKSWLNHARVTRGTPGSARLDVWDASTGTVFDFKFVRNPGLGLGTRQINHINNNGPLGILQILEVNP